MAIDSLQSLREENAALRAKLMSLDGLCPFCKENDADLLCDAVIGIEGYVGDLKGTRYFKGLGGELFTCDMMICENCRERGDAVFFNGGDDLARHKIFVPDFCPIHHDAETFANTKGVGPTLKGEAIAWRNRAKMALQLDGWAKLSPVAGKYDL